MSLGSGKRKSYFLLFSFLLVALLLVPFSLQIHTVEHIKLSTNLAYAADWRILTDPIGWLKDFVSNAVRAATVGVAYLALQLSDGIFSTVLYYSLVNFAQTFNDTLKEAVDHAWTLSRDFANLIIISMFVYAAVGTILRLKDYNLEKFIVKIIIVALLINFSMFMVKFAVDVSNIIAYQFYKEIAVLAENQQDNDNKNNAQIYIGSLIAKQMGVTSVMFNKELDNLVKKEKVWLYTTFIVYPVMAFILAFTAGVLIYGSLVMLSRFLGLILVMALSAVGFVMLIVPKIGDNYFHKWWQGLLRYALFAPIFSFMLLLVVTIIAYMGKTAGTENTDLITLMATGSWGVALISPFIVIGLLFSAIKISNSLSIAGSNMAMKLTGNTMSAALLPSLWGIRKARIAGAHEISKNKYLEKLSGSRVAKLTGLYKPIDQLRYSANKIADKQTGMHIGDTALGKKLSDMGLKFGSSMKGLDSYQKEELKKGILSREKTALEKKIERLKKKTSQASEDKTNQGKESAKKDASGNKINTEQITTKVKELDKQNQSASDARAQAEEQAQKAATEEKIVKVAQDAKQQAAQVVSADKAQDAVKRLREKLTSLRDKSAMETADSILNDPTLTVQDYSPEIQKALSELESAYRAGDEEALKDAYRILLNNANDTYNNTNDQENILRPSQSEINKNAWLGTKQDLSDDTINAFGADFKALLNSVSDENVKHKLISQNLDGSAATWLDNARKIYQNKSVKDNPTVEWNGQQSTLKEQLGKLFEKHGIDTELFEDAQISPDTTQNSASTNRQSILSPEQKNLKPKRSWFEQKRRNRKAYNLKKLRQLETKLKEVNSELGTLSSDDPTDIAYKASKLSSGAQKKFVENLKRNLDDQAFEKLIQEMDKHKKKD